MNETITLEKKILMDLLSLTASMAVAYATSMAPGYTSDGILVTIEKELNRGDLFNKPIPDAVKGHIIAIVNNYRHDHPTAKSAGMLLSLIVATLFNDAHGNILDAKEGASNALVLVEHLTEDIRQMQEFYKNAVDSSESLMK